MNSYKLILPSVWLLLSVVCPQSKGWSGIVPLHSTRADVERLMGSPSDSNKVMAYYHLEKETITIQYTTSGCEKGHEWNVPPGTVLSITISQKIKPKLSELQIDLTKFKKEANPHVGDIVYYVNKEEGIGIETRVNEESVYSISYTATTKDTHLRCPITRSKNPRHSCSGRG
jgi:hypothetical protein